MTEELKPCPFEREHSKISLLVFSIFYDGSYSVYKDDKKLSEDEYVKAVCGECGAEGPSGNTGIEAIKRWNRRASLWVYNPRGICEDQLPDHNSIVLCQIEYRQNLLIPDRLQGKGEYKLLRKVDMLDNAEFGVLGWMPIPELPEEINNDT
jgi:hypothetical protein